MKKSLKIIAILYLIVAGLLLVDYNNCKKQINFINSSSQERPISYPYYGTVIGYATINDKKIVFVMSYDDKILNFQITKDTEYINCEDKFENKETGFDVAIESYYRLIDIDDNIYPLSIVSERN